MGIRERNLAVRENILLPLASAGGTEGNGHAAVEDLARGLSIEARLDAFPHQLSGGEMQRVSIARALAGGQPLLLCDEPTGNLDSETTRQVMEVLVDACRAEKITAVLVSHDHALERYATRVISIDSGKLVEDRPGELATVKGAVMEAGRSSRKVLKSLAEKARQFSQR